MFHLEACIENYFVIFVAIPLLDPFAEITMADIGHTERFERDCELDQPTPSFEQLIEFAKEKVEMKKKVREWAENVVANEKPESVKSDSTMTSYKLENEPNSTNVPSSDVISFPSDTVRVFMHSLRLDHRAELTRAFIHKNSV